MCIRDRFNTSGADERDTVLDLKEFDGVLKKSGIEIPSNQMRALQKLLDNDGNGVLDVGELESAAKRRATNGCFNVTSTRVFSDQWYQKQHSPYENVRRDDHPSQDMSSETEWETEPKIRSLES